MLIYFSCYVAKIKLTSFVQVHSHFYISQIVFLSILNCMDIEKECLLNISKGNTKAFDSLFILHYPRVKNFIMSLVKNEEDARDLSQDIFLKIWNNREKLSEIQYFRTYLFQMSKNAVFDFFKENIRFDDYEGEYKIKDFDSLEESIEAHDLEMLIDTLVESMPEQRKKIYKMSRKEGLTNDEISIKLKISKRTVETHISNALKDIKKLLFNVFLFFY